MMMRRTRRTKDDVRMAVRRTSSPTRKVEVLVAKDPTPRKSHTSPPKPSDAADRRP